MQKITPANEHERYESPRWKAEISDEIMARMALQTIIVDSAKGLVSSRKVFAKIKCFGDIIDAAKALLEVEK